MGNYSNYFKFKDTSNIDRDFDYNAAKSPTRFSSNYFFKLSDYNFTYDGRTDDTVFARHCNALGGLWAAEAAHTSPKYRYLNTGDNTITELIPAKHGTAPVIRDYECPTVSYKSKGIYVYTSTKTDSVTRTITWDASTNTGKFLDTDNSTEVVFSEQVIILDLQAPGGNGGEGKYQDSAGYVAGGGGGGSGAFIRLLVHVPSFYKIVLTASTPSDALSCSNDSGISFYTTASTSIPSINFIAPSGSRGEQMSDYYDSSGVGHWKKHETACAGGKGEAPFVTVLPSYKHSTLSIGRLPAEWDESLKPCLVAPSTLKIAVLDFYSGRKGGSAGVVHLATCDNCASNGTNGTGLVGMNINFGNLFNSGFVSHQGGHGSEVGAVVKNKPKSGGGGGGASFYSAGQRGGADSDTQAGIGAGGGGGLCYDLSDSIWGSASTTAGGYGGNGQFVIRLW